MKTKQIPVIIMLTAGLVTSIAAVINHMESAQLIKILVVVLVVFYMLGCLAKVILDKNFKEEEEEATEKAAEEETEEELETEFAQKEEQQ